MINVIIDRCKECNLCVMTCPRGVLERGNELNSYGYRYVNPKNPDRCVGCRLCEYVCPDFAIFILGEVSEGRVFNR